MTARFDPPPPALAVVAKGWPHLFSPAEHELIEALTDPTPPESLDADELDLLDRIEGKLRALKAALNARVGLS